jgi:hypothetical protein
MMGHFGCDELLGGLNVSNDQKRSSQPAVPHGTAVSSCTCSIHRSRGCTATNRSSRGP